MNPVRWLFATFWLPVADAFDLVDNAGQVDHGKAAGFLAFWVFVWLVVVDRLPPLGHTIVMFSAMFGSRVFIAFLKSRTVTATETVVENHQITERRDTEKGVETTP